MGFKMKKFILLTIMLTNGIISTAEPVPTNIFLFINDSVLTKQITLDKDWPSSTGNLKIDATDATNQYAIESDIDLSELNCDPIKITIGFLDANPDLLYPIYYSIDKSIDHIPDDKSLFDYIQDQVNADHPDVIIGDLEEISTRLACNN